MPSLTHLLVRLAPLAASLFSLASADPPAFNALEATEYDKGGYGLYPEVKYKTSKLVSSHILRRKWDDRCEKSPGYIFFAPRGMLVGHPGPMILDNDGQMVWHSEAFPITYGLTVQEYRKEKYLTFWSGDDQVIGHGSGSYYMFDSSYRQYKKIDPVGNMTGDLHEFKITRDNTALITSYVQIPWDLSSFGRPANSWIWDCIFQEIDLETNELLFEWKAIDHFTFDDCYNPVRNTGAANNAWDWFHINSVDKDKHGNYIISSRYSHAVTYIHGRTGQIIWHLGGKNNSFTDLSDGHATDFAWQHDARWADDYKSISLFDNHAYFADQVTGARGIKVELDFSHRTARLIGEAKHPRGYISESQGSMQILPNGNFFLGYGSAANFAEFAPNGELLCDMQFGALHYHKDGSFSPSAVMSYRAYRHDWVGHPVDDPLVKFDEGKMFVSWNGATEVKSWILDGTNALGSGVNDWDMISQFLRVGFESNTTVDDTAYRLFRLTALDKNDKFLGMWIVFSGGEVKAIPLPVDSTTRSIFLVLFGAALALIVVGIFGRRLDFRSRFDSLWRDYSPTRAIRPKWATGEATLNYEDVERLTPPMAEKQY